MIQGLDIPQGRYVVATSGGVDSMVLLDLLFKKFDSDNLIVAYFNHRVRSASEISQDIKVISEYCENNQLRFEVGEHSGRELVSESSMRNARYSFLAALLKNNNYDAVITAHHKDDLTETAVLNLLRGTAGAGLNSIQNERELLRPLLGASKEEILEYAKANELLWNEDSTNTDESYLRNYVRGTILPKFSESGQLSRLEELIAQQRPLEQDADLLMRDVTNASVMRLDTVIEVDRPGFILLPHVVAMRLMHGLLAGDFLKLEPSRELVMKATIFGKTAAQCKAMDLGGSATLKVADDKLRLSYTD